MGKVLQLKVILSNIRPKIWRRFQIKDSTTFEELHEIIQDVMGWEDYHLYEFKVDDKIISASEDGGGFNVAEAALDKLTKSPEFQNMLSKQDLDKQTSLDVNKVNKILEKAGKERKTQEICVMTPIKDFVSEGQTFSYRYDFGDNWQHDIIVEKILDENEADKKIPVCIDGERACPPEDCGGIWGYEELLQTRKDKNHQDYEERIIEWLGEDFDPEEFNVEEVNKLLWGIDIDEEEYSEEDGKAFKEELIKDFVPLNNLLLEDNDEIKKLKSLFKKEGEYGFFLGSIEIPIKSYYQFNKGITDKDVVKMLENIKSNYDKDVRFFNKELEQMIMCMLSMSLRAKKITCHELMLIIDYLLWSISNREYLGPTGYLNWLLEFFPEPRRNK